MVRSAVAMVFLFAVACSRSQSAAPRDADAGSAANLDANDPKALLAAWRAGTERVTGLLRCRGRSVLGRFDPSRDGDGDLHGRFREVEVRPVEDPKLHQAHGLGACHGEGLYRWRDSLSSR